MAKSLQPWLGTFIRDELAAVIEWRQDTLSAPKVKRDPESRFDDDGSNFRSSVNSPAPTVDAKVQLLKVFAVGTSPTVLLSDGTSAVRAKLSTHAVGVIEEELEEPLSLEAKGDVLSLLALKVVSTPYGPADGHVQLEVDDLQYQYHLRKTVGNPQPIQQQDAVASLVERVRETRLRQYAGEESDGAGEEQYPAQEASSDAVMGATLQNDQTGKQPRAASPTSSGAQSQLTGASSAPQTQARIATQVKTSAKNTRKGPSLAKEGYELADGLNLAQPLGRSLGPAHIDEPGNVVRSGEPSTKAAALLNLLGGPVKASPKVAPEPEIVEVNRSVETRETEPQNHRGSQSSLPAEADAEPDSERSIKRRRIVGEDADVRIAYARRKIPAQQQRLLEKKESWFPALPGRQFPTPNVPIELLQAWTSVSETSKSNAAGATVGDQDSAAKVQPNDHDENDALIMDDHHTHQEGHTNAQPEKAILISSEDESTSDDELSRSQWPASQPSLPRATSPQPKGSSLPPDSTLGSVQGPSPVAGLHSAPLDSPNKPMGTQSSAASGLGTPQDASTQQLPLCSPDKRPQPPKSSNTTSGDQYIPPYSSLRSAEPARSRDGEAPARSQMPQSLRGGDHYRPSYSPRTSREAWSRSPSLRHQDWTHTRSTQRAPGTKDYDRYTPFYSPPDALQRPSTANSSGSQVDSLRRHSDQRDGNAARTDRVRRREEQGEQHSELTRERPARSSLAHNDGARYEDISGTIEALPQRAHSNQQTNSASLARNERPHWAKQPPPTLPLSSSVQREEHQRRNVQTPTSASWSSSTSFSKHRPHLARDPPATLPLSGSLQRQERSHQQREPQPLVSQSSSASARQQLEQRAPSAKVPWSTGAATVIKGTQLSNEGSDMEMDVPRPLQDPALDHQQKRREHLRNGQRKKWLLDNYVVSYEAGPYLQTVRKKYTETHSSDPVSSEDFKKALDEAFPSLRGRDRVRSLKPKGMPSSTTSTPVRADHLDGSYEADERTRSDAGPDATRDKGSSANKRRTRPENGTATISTYEDRRPHKQPKTTRTSREPACPPASSRKAGPTIPPAKKTPSNGNNNQVPRTHHIDGQASSNPVSRSLPRSSQRDAQADDTHGAQSTCNLPATPFEDFAQAWKSLAPGGAFAQPGRRRTRREAPRPVDVLGWRF